MRLYYVAFILFLLGTTAGAQSAGESVVASKAAVLHGVSSDKLVLFSRPIFAFRGTLLGVSAPDRAKRAHARIHGQLEIPGPHAVSVKADSLGIEIQIDSATSFVVTPGDLDPAREESLEHAAQRAAAALTVAIRESAESRSLETLTRALALAVAGTALYSALVWFAFRARRVLLMHLVALTDRHTAGSFVKASMCVWRTRRARSQKWASSPPAFAPGWAKS